MSSIRYRTRIEAQDLVIAGIVAVAKASADPEVVKAIKEIGAKLANQWGVKHADLPDTRRSAGQ